MHKKYTTAAITQFFTGFVAFKVRFDIITFTLVCFLLFFLADCKSDHVHRINGSPC